MLDRAVMVSRSGGNIVLGLCWLKKERNKFLAGSENGCIELFDVEKMKGTQLVVIECCALLCRPFPLSMSG